MMFPRISKFSNLSTTSAPSQSTDAQSNLRAGSHARRGNDSTNIKNLLFGGYEEPTPSKAPQFYPPSASPSASTDLLSPSQPIPHKAQTLHSS